IQLKRAGPGPARLELRRVFFFAPSRFEPVASPPPREPRGGGYEERPMNRRTFLTVLAIGGVLAGPALAETPKEIRLDYAYYNPVALLLKDKGWVEEEFAKDGATVRWVLSLGSNKALEFLNSGSIDFGSSAGGAALV